jgi:hypothetical protein
MQFMNFVTELLLGVALAFALIVIFRSVSFRDTVRLWAIALIVAAVIYVGFALMGGAPPPWLLLEVVGVIGYGAFALLALRFSIWWLVLGWFLHVAWDVLVHAPNPGFVPSWYPAVCVGFDVIIGISLAVQSLRQRQELAHSKHVRS